MISEADKEAKRRWYRREYDRAKKTECVRAVLRCPQCRAVKCAKYAV